ncbi:hypothetical protein ACL02O_20635 [Micromonospora sp. MS34]|uniref:ferredoxin reductase family protein n=1 Tax=Micromonospora sp. MS34 TaxID=3385971 RepID=UPI0039A20AF8
MGSDPTAEQADMPAALDDPTSRCAGTRPVGGRGAAGVAALAAVATGNLVLWLVAGPSGESAGRFVGELCGAEAVLLFVCALVLTTLLPPIERAFGGLDRVALWHRRLAVVGVLLLVPHLALGNSPPDPYGTTLGRALGSVALYGIVFLSLWALAPSLRAARWPGPVRRLAKAGYERWLASHRFMGLFVAVAVVHGATVAVILHRSTVLDAVYLVTGVVGVAAYLYREIFARYVVPVHQYSVAAVERLNGTTVNVGLDPVGDPLVFIPGQFVFVAFGGPGGWRRHPFTVASSPSVRRLTVSVKAAGDDTYGIYHRLRPGIPARITGPFGGFDHRYGGRDQIWIAGGIGITPFLSWLRSVDQGFDRNVDLYYCVAHARDALFIDEITATAAGHPSLRLHLVVADRDGQLTASSVMGGRGSEQVWVYMCGPPAMMTSLSRGFRAHGVPTSRIRWERFDVR